MRRVYVFCCLALLGGHCTMAQEPAGYRRAETPIATRWADEVTSGNALPEYPRPQLIRNSWLNLNGLWEYAIRPKEDPAPETYDGRILVPYPIESGLSGVKKAVGAQQRLWYRKRMELPLNWRDKNLLLHFGAVDWEAEVYINGELLERHRGGYESFSVDISEAIAHQTGLEIVVGVWDPTDTSWQPRGKQAARPEGIWYTAVTGIWQTVWMEEVPEDYISELKISPDVDASAIRLKVLSDSLRPNDVLEVVVFDEDGKDVAVAEHTLNREFEIKLENPRLWSPDDPYLYGLFITLKRYGQAHDVVRSYFGMRKIAVEEDGEGVPRLYLNNRPLFQLGALNQGWWPEGLYTAPTDEALRYDLEVLKEFGFNMLRAHVKVEPARFYFHCDRMGLLVWQDMPSGDAMLGPEDPDIHREAASMVNYRREYKAVIDQLYNHPSVVAWVPFNEGWGQFSTNEVINWTRGYDPTRLVDGPSGWADRGVGDMLDMHKYPGPDKPAAQPGRAAVLGEFGGLGWPVEGHLWQPGGNWGYETLGSQEDFTRRYVELMRGLRPLIDAGLAAAVYTQTTDVEGEVNGLMTYDRKVIKLNAELIAPIHRELYRLQDSTNTINTP